MAKIITENFRVETANELYKSFFNKNNDVRANFESAFSIYNVVNESGLSEGLIDAAGALVLDELNQELPENNYYIFGSSVDSHAAIANTQAQKREFQRRIIFGNKLTERDIKYIFNLNEWATGTIYDQFDDTIDLTNSNFYVTVLDGNPGEGSYKVYKCLRNNGRSPSTINPSTSSELADSNYELSLADGYVWKYMFDVPATEYTIYATTTGLPYAANEDVQRVAVESISNIEIEQTQTALFSDYALGGAYLNSVIEDDTSINQYRLEIVTTVAPRSSEDAYKDMTLRLVNTGDIYTIVGSAIPDIPGLDVTENRRLYIYVQSDTTLINLYDQGASVSISPKVNVSKSTGESATAYGILDSQGTLTKIEFINKGTEYKFAEAELVLPPTLLAQKQQAGDDYIDTVLRVICSPRGGHGSDPINELFMSKLAIITNFYSDSSRNTPDSNFYTKVGLIKNPTFTDGSYPATIDNRMVMTASGNVTNDIVAVDSIVTQVVNGETVTGRIHEISYDLDTNTTTIYLVDYIGAYASTFTTGQVTIRVSTTAEDSSTISINSVTQGKYETYSGDLLHFVDFEQVERQPDRKEKIKFVFDF
jgi:hypothetical protein